MTKFRKTVGILKRFYLIINVPKTLQTVNDTAYRYTFRSPIAALSINWWIQSSTVSNILSSGYEKCFPVTLDPICPCWIWLFVRGLHFYLRFLYFCRLFWTLVHLCVETLRSYFFCWEWTVRWLIFTPVLHWWWTHEYCIWSQRFDHYSSHIMFL